MLHAALYWNVYDSSNAPGGITNGSLAENRDVFCMYAFIEYVNVVPIKPTASQLMIVSLNTSVLFVPITTQFTQWNMEGRLGLLSHTSLTLMVIWKYGPVLSAMYSVTSASLTSAHKLFAYPVHCVMTRGGLWEAVAKAANRANAHASEIGFIRTPRNVVG